MLTAEIAGGGVAGLVASIQLARQGWSVRLHERAHGLRASGNGFPIFENGLRVLEALGLRDEIPKRGHQLDRWVIRRSNGDKVVEYEPFAATGGRIVMFWRQALVDMLAETAAKAGVRIELGSRVVAADRRGMLQLENGERLKADLVIGADGVHSAVRKTVAGELPLGRHRKGAIRLMIPIEDGDFAPGEERTAVEHNDPSGRRIGLYPCSREIMYMILVHLLDDTEVAGVPIDPQKWKATFPHLGKYIDRVGSMGHFDEYHSIDPPAWHYGNCAIVGDAAHGMTPALGQGANCAMMTGYTLGSSDFSNYSIPDALERWEQFMRPRIRFVQDFAEGMTAGRLDPKNEIFFSDPALRPLFSTDVAKLKW